VGGDRNSKLMVFLDLNGGTLYSALLCRHLHFELDKWQASSLSVIQNCCDKVVWLLLNVHLRWCSDASYTLLLQLVNKSDKTGSCVKWAYAGNAFPVRVLSPNRLTGFWWNLISEVLCRQSKSCRRGLILLHVRHTRLLMSQPSAAIRISGMI
jgi:hypothetical protein